MLFTYKVLTKEGEVREGSIDTLSEDSAIRSLQQRGFTIVSLVGAEEKGLFGREIFVAKSVPLRDIVLLSKQISVLFSAHVSVLKAFQMLAEESTNPLLKKTLGHITTDIQGGSSIADALNKHPRIFSNFYVNMVRVGEEAGKLNEIFEYMADYLNRNYELTVKARNALTYPVFVIGVFVLIMTLLLTVIYPKLADILQDVGQEIPFYTKAIIALSDFLVHYWIFILVALIIGGGFLFRYAKTEDGRTYVSKFKLNVPVIGNLMRKFYLSRISDSMFTMLTSGVPLVRTLEVTVSVVQDATYEDILKETVNDVKGGSLVSESFGKHEEIPGVMRQIIRAGEETGELGKILKVLAEFYRREVYNAVEVLVGLVEPILIVLLGVGVGIVVASVLVPIYNISTGF